MLKFPFESQVYQVRDWLNNEEADALLAKMLSWKIKVDSNEKDPTKLLDQMDQSKLMELKATLNPFMVKMIKDPKVTELNEVPAEITYQILMHILNAGFKKIMNVIGAVPDEQKKS